MFNKKRKQTFVDSHVQGALIKRIFAHWGIFFFVTCFLIAAMNAFQGDPALPLFDRMWGESGTLAMVGVVMGVLFPAFALDTIRFSNRFVGPITRLRRCLRDLGQTGNSERIKFRENDFWMEMANEFNNVADRVEGTYKNSTVDEGELVAQD